MNRSLSLFRLLGRDPVSVRLLGFALALSLVCLVLWALPRDATQDARSLGWIMLATAAAAMLLCGAWSAYRLLRIRGMLRRGVRVAGDVLKVNTNSEDVWHIVLGYRFESHYHEAKIITGGRPAWRVGDAVALLVDPQQPARAVIQAMWEAA